MASLTWTVPAVPVSQVTVLSAKKVEEKKGLFDWLSDALQKDQLMETDPVLQKDSKNGASNKAPAGGKKSSAPQKKGGFFGKK